MRNFCASSSIRAFSSALYGRPGEGGSGNFSALSRRRVARIRIALLAAEPDQQLHLVVDGLGAGLLAPAESVWYRFTTFGVISTTSRSPRRLCHVPEGILGDMSPTGVWPCNR